MSDPMATGRPTRTYTARTPVDLLAMVPYLLGFQPRDSLVVLTFGVPGGCFHARVDLPAAAAGQEQVAEEVMRAVLRHAVPRVALICYSRDAVASQQQCELLLARLREAQVEVVDVIRADGERFFHVPELGRAGTAYDLSAHPFTAERVLDGDVALDSREQLAESLVGPFDAPLTAAVREQLDRVIALARDVPEAGLGALRTEARWLQRRIRLHLRDGRPLGASDGGRLIALSGLDPLRDVAWSEMTRATAVGHVALWRDLVRRCPPTVLAPVASLLAFAAWLSGDGALSWCAVDRALDADPDYSMAHLVADALAGAVAPTVWRPVPEGELLVFAGDE